MIQPIVLTKEGETLTGYPESAAGDEGKLDGCIGIHAVCTGYIDIRPVSHSHNVILCRLCRLRVVVPNTIVTYGDLRTYLTFKGITP